MGNCCPKKGDEKGKSKSGLNKKLLSNRSKQSASKGSNQSSGKKGTFVDNNGDKYNQNKTIGNLTEGTQGHIDLDEDNDQRNFGLDDFKTYRVGFCSVGSREGRIWSRVFGIVEIAAS
jgi:hypothetical protein